MSSERPSAFPPILVLLSLAVTTVVAACARNPSPVPPPVSMEPTAVESLLSSLEREQRSIRRYQGFVRVRGRGPDGGFDARLVLIFERPERLRVELLGAFGRTRWSAVASDEGILVVFPGRGDYVREDDVGEVVGRLLGVPLEAGEVMAILSGGGVPLASPSAASGARRGEQARIALEHGVELEIGGDGQLVRARTPTYEVSYPTSWRTAGRQVPDRIAIASAELRATMSVESIDVNVELDPEAFALSVPDGGHRLRPAQIDGEAVFVKEREPGEALR